MLRKLEPKNATVKWEETMKNDFTYCEAKKNNAGRIL